MTFDLHISGDTPEDLMTALLQLRQGFPNACQNAPNKTHQQQPTAADVTEEKPAPAQDAPQSASAPGLPVTATLEKIRDLARILIVNGKRLQVQQIIKNTGAASISKLPADRYSDVWERLVKLSEEVDANAAG